MAKIPENQTYFNFAKKFCYHGSRNRHDVVGSLKITIFASKYEPSPTFKFFKNSCCIYGGFEITKPPTGYAGELTNSDFAVVAVVFVVVVAALVVVVIIIINMFVVVLSLLLLLLLVLFLLLLLLLLILLLLLLLFILRFLFLIRNVLQALLTHLPTTGHRTPGHGKSLSVQAPCSFAVRLFMLGSGEEAELTSWTLSTT